MQTAAPSKPTSSAPKSELLESLNFLSSEERAELDWLLKEPAAAPTIWTPSTVQKQAMDSQADILLYGGQAGGGKTDLLLGLALEHHRSIIFRREATQLDTVIERSHEIFDEHGVYVGGQKKTWQLPGYRSLKLAGVKDPGDEKKFQGQPHDLKAFDEVTHFTEMQFRYLSGWNRSSKQGQRCRIVAASNPPTTPEEEWVIRFWAAWLDPQHPNPAKPGELRWYTTIDGKDVEVPSGEPFEHTRPDSVVEFIKPKSRTFIAAKLQDNPYLRDTNYEATLQALPEPLRSKLLYGSFTAGREDSPFQVIPTAWVVLAQDRWKARERPTTPLTAIGVDVARGGKDKTVLTERYDNWYAEQQSHPGQETPNGQVVAQLVVVTLNGRKAMVNVDVIGVGSSVYDALGQIIDGDAVAMNGSEKSHQRDKSEKLGFVNKRAEWWWKFREALDPVTGDDVALPPDRELLADLTAPTWKLRQNGIQIESKDDIVARIGRSPDRGESLIYAASINSDGATGLLDYYRQAAEAKRRNAADPETKGRSPWPSH